MSFRPTVLPAWLLAAAVVFLPACRDTGPTEVPTIPGFSSADGSPTVTSTNPDTASQDTTLNVHVFGSGFDRGSKAQWAQSGVVSPNVTTNATQYVSAKELVANITIAVTASPGSYDVLVTTSKGQKGIGTELFTIKARAVATVTVTPTTLTMVAGSTAGLMATTLDVAGKVLTGRTVTWTTSDPAVATVSQTGLVTGVTPGSGTITAASEGKSGTATITVIPLIHGSLVFTAVRSGSLHACGILTDGSVRCWGSNSYGELGDGTTTERLIPVAVSGGFSFTAVSPGWAATCGITTTRAGYCWGGNITGLFGDGSGNNSLTPVPAASGLSLAGLNQGDQHTCGLTPSGTSYCWGWNRYGQLGNGSKTDSPVPVPVSGDLTFGTLTTSGPADHTCGLTAGGSAYCWGLNRSGQIGTPTSDTCTLPLSRKGTVSCALTPVAVSGGFTFAAVSAGGGHTCGVTTSGAAYCWGDNIYGALGNGTTTSAPTPVAVAGGLSFVTVSAGDAFSCGLTTAGVVYCWGWNTYDQLGNGTTINSSTPVPVSGGLTFSTISVGSYYVCGLATSGGAYCWGRNNFGQLGNGTLTSSPTPSRVAEQP
jgi:alpha-tubulin suppressor-like RCC1 family protein